MKLLQKLSLGLLSLAAMCVVAVGFDATSASAAEKKDDTKQAASYSYEAQEGDAYSQIARKAVQTYGINEKVKLSQAQIIFAETTLTQKAGSPFLEIGQKVTVKKTDVKTVVDQAKKLDAATLAAWQAYVPYVDFDTKNIGE